MSWESEAREVKQQKYGGYCLFCKRNNIPPVPYHQFTLELYKETRDNYRQSKNK